MSRFEIPRSKQKKPTLKCIVCGKKAIGGYSVDLDVEALLYCKAHKSDIGTATIALVLGNRKLYDDIIKAAKKK